MTPVRTRTVAGIAALVLLAALAVLAGCTPRPPGVGVRGSHSSELVLVAKTYTM